MDSQKVHTKKNPLVVWHFAATLSLFNGWLMEEVSK